MEALPAGPVPHLKIIAPGNPNRRKIIKILPLSFGSAPMKKHQVFAHARVIRQVQHKSGREPTFGPLPFFLSQRDKFGSILPFLQIYLAATAPPVNIQSSPASILKFQISNLKLTSPLVISAPSYCSNVLLSHRHILSAQLKEIPVKFWTIITVGGIMDK